MFTQDATGKCVWERWIHWCLFYTQRVCKQKMWHVIKQENLVISFATTSHKLFWQTNKLYEATVEKKKGKKHGLWILQPYKGENAKENINHGDYYFSCHGNIPPNPISPCLHCLLSSGLIVHHWNYSDYTLRMKKCTLSWQHSTMFLIISAPQSEM